MLKINYEHPDAGAMPIHDLKPTQVVWMLRNGERHGPFFVCAGLDRSDRFLVSLDTGEVPGTNGTELFTVAEARMTVRA